MTVNKHHLHPHELGELSTLVNLFGNRTEYMTQYNVLQLVLVKDLWRVLEIGISLTTSAEYKAELIAIRKTLAP